MVDAWSFWNMTPREISGRLAAYAAINEKQAEDMDALAWMIGNYASFAYHEPRKFPKKPSIVVDTKPKSQSEESMKAVLRTLKDTAK